MNDWYCVRTRRYKENWVSHQLLDMGKESFLPLLRERRFVRRQWKDVIEPLFPCYLFVRCTDRSDFRLVNTLFGVVNIVSSIEHGPLQVDEQIITTLQNRSVDGYITVQPLSFSVDDRLEVIAGPFRGLTVLFQRELKAGERVAVLMQILSSWVRVDLPRVYVQKQTNDPGWKAVA